MKLIYLLNQRFPTEKGYGIQVAKMCEAFGRNGFAVELVRPSRDNDFKVDPYDYYDVDRIFTIREIDAAQFKFFIFSEKITFWSRSVWSGIKLARYALSQRANVIYSRDELALLFCALFGLGAGEPRLIFEAHYYSAKRKFAYRFLANRGVLFVAISNGVKKALIDCGVDAGVIKVAPDGVDLEEFEIEDNKLINRKKFGLPEDKKIAMYTGHLYDWKGIDALIESVDFLNDAWLVVLAGGRKDDLDKARTKGSLLKYPKRLLFLGHVDYKQIPSLLKCADVLLMPASNKHEISKSYISPLKLFMYMAARRPIVASSIASLKEIIDDSCVFFFAPNNSRSMTEAIIRAFVSPQNANLRAIRAYERVQGYDWNQRAKTIYLFAVKEKLS